jgi:hypothetical protein
VAASQRDRIDQVRGRRREEREQAVGERSREKNSMEPIDPPSSTDIATEQAKYVSKMRSAGRSAVIG